MASAVRMRHGQVGGIGFVPMRSRRADSLQQNARRIAAVIPKSIDSLPDDDALERDAAKLLDLLKLDDDEAREKMRVGAYLARYAYVWDRIVNDDPDYMDRRPPGGIQLDESVAQALREERYKLFSQRGIHMVTVAVMCAAFLQGCVQSSINGSSLYLGELNINGNFNDNWVLGITNSIPFFSAALLGCWLSIPVNHYWGRRGAMLLSAVLVGIASLLAGLVPIMIPAPIGPRWQALLAIRFVNGIGMGIKAVSTPILASETSVQFWRGSFLLAWQIWVACGMLVGFAFNLITTAATNKDLTVALILGAPVVPAIVLIITLWWCPESPRYYLRLEKPNYTRAFEELKRLRSNCELLAYKDMYLLHKSIEEEYELVGLSTKSMLPSNLMKFSELFSNRRLRNALITSSTVALAQQLCGINISAFYSGTFFSSLLAGSVSFQSPKSDLEIKQAMGLSFGFGAVNFVFGLPAIRTIDSVGRRKLLISTLPLMCIFMAAAAVDCYILDVPEALASFHSDADIENSVQTFRVRRVGLVAACLYLHAVAYSPGLGPIPFTLASESFPLSHREIGCAFVIAVNLFFGGVLSIFVPALNSSLQSYGLLALFCGLTFVALVLVYLLVEETKELSLEQLSEVFNSSKSQYVKNNARQAWWWVRRFTWPDPLRPDPPVPREWERIEVKEEAPMAASPLASGEVETAATSASGHLSDEYSLDSRDPRA